MTGSWPGVIVTTRSAESASSSDAATSAAELGRRLLRPLRVHVEDRHRPAASEERPRSRLAVDAGADDRGGSRRPARPSVSAASTAAAPVRSAVTAAASKQATSRPSSALESSTSPVTVGSPLAGLPGNDVTHLSAA